MKFSSIMRLACLGLIIAITIIALLPSSQAPALFMSDKLNHMLAFFTLAIIAVTAWPKWHPLIPATLLVGYGGIIEIAQWSMGFGREADWLDFLADVVAIIAGMLAGQILNVSVRRFVSGQNSGPVA